MPIKLKSEKYTSDDFIVQVTSNGLLIKNTTLTGGDRLEMDIDGKKASFGIVMDPTLNLPKIKIPMNGKVSRAFEKALLTDLRSAVGIVPRGFWEWVREILFKSPTLWRKVCSLVQDLATIIAAAGLYFGLTALLPQADGTLSEAHRNAHMIWMVRTILGFTICWAFALFFRFWSYVTDL